MTESEGQHHKDCPAIIIIIIIIIIIGFLCDRTEENSRLYNLNAANFPQKWYHSFAELNFVPNMVQNSLFRVDDSGYMGAESPIKNTVAFLL